ncbi:MAG: peptidylprolyl isomerase [Caulobacter sp.]|nr:peptidylprolyl isomerase [Caulobacter sp.]
MIRRSFLAGTAALAGGSLVAGPVLAQTATPGVVRLIMTTGEGPLVLELYGDKAPITVANFLRYVDAGLYNRGEIYRASQAPGAPEIGLVQGGARPGKLFPPIAHESTAMTGLTHVDGTLSMARGALGTATSDFFIICGGAPYLDARPDGAGDGAGYAAFGQVVEGMEIVRRILEMPKTQEAENPVMKGQMLAAPVPIITTVRA